MFARFRSIAVKMIIDAKYVPNAFQAKDVGRYTVSWLSSLAPWRNTLKDGQPWLSFSATEWLKNHLTSNMRVFEFGSGGSTLFFARFVKQVVSVEHDPIWFPLVNQQLIQSQISNVQYHLITPQPVSEISSSSSSNATKYRSENPQYSSFDFRQYVSFIDQYSDQTFDLVMIDGRARLACIEHSLPKVKSGGYLILDNSDRELYQSAFLRLQDYERQDFSGITPYGYPHISTTTMWRIMH